MMIAFWDLTGPHSLLQAHTYQPISPGQLPLPPFQQADCPLHIGTQAGALCHHESLHDQPHFRRDTFTWNGYGDRQIRQALNPLQRVTLPQEKPTSIALLPFVSTTFNRITRMQ